MKQVTIIQIVVFIVLSFWIGLFIVPNYPNLIDWMLVAGPIVLLGYTWAPLSIKMFILIKELTDSIETDKRDKNV